MAAASDPQGEQNGAATVSMAAQAQPRAHSSWAAWRRRPTVGGVAQRKPPHWPNEVMRWAWAVRYQERRLRQAQVEALTAQADSGRRGVYTTEHLEAFYRLDVERHFLVIAAHQLAVLLENVDTAKSFPQDLRENITLLRHALEHLNDWDAGRSFQRLADVAPMALPTSHRWTTDGRALLGGVVDTTDLLHVATEILEALRLEENERDPWTFAAPAHGRRGTSIRLQGLWMHDATEPSDYVQFDRLLDGSVHNLEVEDVNGVRRISERLLADGLTYVIAGVTDDQRRWLKQFISKPVMARDPSGGLVFGTYKSIDPISDLAGGVRLTLEIIDWDISV